MTTANSSQLRHHFRITFLTAFCTVCSASLCAAEPQLRIVETEAALMVLSGDRTILTYNKVSPSAPVGIASIYERSGCLHPVVTPLGHAVTDMFPADHPHQQGIFSAWVKTKYDGRPVDFWNLAAGTGRVVHEGVVSRQTHAGKVSFEVDLLHQITAEPAIDVLRERWKVTVHDTNPACHCFDLSVIQTALTDTPLVVRQHRYGGVAVRGPEAWLGTKDQQPAAMLNDQGADRQKGNHQPAKWVTMSGLIEQQPVTIAMLSHPENFRAPQSARLHPNKPYFCFAPCVTGSFQIDRDHPYKARYRFLVTDTTPDTAWLNAQWTEWSQE